MTQKATESKAVAIKAENAIVQFQELRDIQSEFQGSVNIRRELIKIPRLKLNNPLSESVQGGLAKPGDFTINVRNENYGETVTIFPLYTDEATSYLDKAGNVICSSFDLINSQDGHKCNACPHKQYWNDWGTKEHRKIPDCKLSINIIALIIKAGEPIDLTNIAEINLRKNNYKAGKELINLIVHDPLQIPFGTKYTLHSRQDKKDKWVYHVIDPHRIETERATQDEIRLVIEAARKVLEWKKQNKLTRDFAADIDDHEVDSQIVSPTPY